MPKKGTSKTGMKPTDSTIVERHCYVTPHTLSHNNQEGLTYLINSVMSVEIIIHNSFVEILYRAEQ